MKTNPRCRFLFVALVATAALSFAGCGGGGKGGDGDGGGGAAVLITITASGLPNPLYQSVSGTPVSPPQPSGPVFLNSTITFTFGGPVDPQSLPGYSPIIGPTPGSAVGSIQITTLSSGQSVPAVGTFSVLDAPNLPPGNKRRVNFTPIPPSDPSNPATAGLGGPAVYVINVPGGLNTPQSVTVGGVPLQQGVTASFFTCDPGGPSGPGACFTDPEPGPPFVVMTTPPTGDPPPAPVSPASVVNNTVSIFVSEPLFPQNINLSNVFLRTQSGAQVPGVVQFFQAGSLQAGPLGSRIDYVASSQLLSSVTYEIEISNAVTDFGGNPLVLYDPLSPSSPASGQRFFQTVTVPFCPQTPIEETFDTTGNRDTVTGVLEWAGTGEIVTTFPLDLVGNGEFGPLVFPPGAGTLDTGMPPLTGPGGGVAFSEGVWNTTLVEIQAGANVRTIGSLYRVHLRSLGTVTIDGTLNGNAGMSMTAPLGDPEQGPRQGNFNNGQGINPTIVAGGVGGVGGGAGGRASQEGTARTPQAETGFGPPVNGVLNTGPYGANPHFGGGEGGAGAFRYPSGGVQGELGGLGGAGGSAFQGGDNGGPTTAAPACTPVAPTVQNRALATGPTAAFLPPINVGSAGSGGGGGGDRFEVGGVSTDDQGGGGGGGGGGIRISCIGNLAVNAGAAILMEGASGAAGNVFFGGGGGGGSGGQIWMQSFADIIISSSAQMRVGAGAAGGTCGDHYGGRGGVGLYQFEDADGQVNTNFIGPSTGGSNISVVTFPFSATVGGVATSTFFDTGYGDPDYTAVSETFTLGNAPGASVAVTYQGAFENLTGGGANLATLTTPVSGANIDQLDGYRFIRFVVTVQYASPPASNLSNTLPRVQFISISYQSPIGCP